MLLVQRPWLTLLGFAALLAVTSCQQKKASPASKSGPAALASGAPAASVPEKPVPELTRKIFLVLEYRNEEPEYVHSVWFMDTAGNEYKYASKQAADDVMRKASDDSQLTAAEIEELVAASTPLPRRVSEAALAQALSKLNSVIQEPVEAVAQGPCNEPGQTYLFAYTLQPKLGVLMAVFLRGEHCSVTSRNPSEAATELADWLEKLGKPKLLPI